MSAVRHLSIHDWSARIVDIELCMRAERVIMLSNVRCTRAQDVTAIEALYPILQQFL
jgi:hypothetical protein